ncbi:RNA pyrophosphohydrolase [Thalassotalea ponticola]|uniref:RNA pyrophosphohydrolase n=1 Tax=Thalassotalea ponticola TaxID=1523392 RepID=UPI0025B38467|nr:RNA pyrophosphohydrolase [Thalassotalea ponticola]MDN3651719.1 RNA pyrophosphohydrolase [Thalassotalea ponticola]
MIDADGYRANVGIVITNGKGQVFWARRYNQHSWQFPQGGVDEGETAEQTMYRELYEEVGLKPHQVEVVATSKHWLKYRLPKRLIRHDSNPVCIGQKQKWFLLKLTCADEDVNLLHSSHPEFDDWRWVSYWYPVRQVVSFKRDVYRRVMKEFIPMALPKGQFTGVDVPNSKVKKTNHSRRNHRRRKAKS